MALPLRFSCQKEALRQWCRERFTADRWLDENEREWYALDRLCRSRPWATNRDKAFPYPFREASVKMMQIEGEWVGGQRRKRVARREMSNAAGRPQRDTCHVTVTFTTI